MGGGVWADQGAHKGTGVSGQKAVTTAGTAVQLSSSTVGIHSLVIRALRANTGIIYVGFSSSVSSTTGLELAAGDAVSLTVPSLSEVYLNSSVSAEGVSYAAT